MKSLRSLGNRKVSPFLSYICSFLIFSAISGLLVFLSYKESAAQDIASDRTFSITSDIDFKNYQDMIKRFARKHRPNASNDFCIIGYIAVDSSKSAWVLWRQGKKIILWEAGETDLDVSRRIIDLEKDVVNSDIDLHGSTYLVTRSWVNNLMAACDQGGTQLHIEKIEKSFRR